MKDIKFNVDEKCNGAVSYKKTLGWNLPFKFNTTIIQIGIRNNNKKNKL